MSAAAPRHGTRVVVFAKDPVPGTVKTRLAPRLGLDGAAALHRELVEHALATALAAQLGTVELCCAPDARGAFFAGCAARHGVTLGAQGEGDLGARMLRAIERGLERAERVVLIGADCPAIDRDYLQAADAALRGAAEVVLGPAEDGGYVLAGARRAVPAMFAAIEWGGSGVLAATRERLTSDSVPFAELATLWDVDRPEDVDRYAAWRRGRDAQRADR